jgi:hypothetical protein
MALFVVLVALAVVGWIRRRRRQAYLPTPDRVPADIGAIRGEFDGFYVSTTLDGEALNRVAVRGLGFRARATLAVADAGVVVSLPGNPIFIPRETIREVTTAQYTIDRVVEAGGLVLLAWRLGETSVDSYFRVEEGQQLIAAIESIVPTKTGPTKTGSTKTGSTKSVPTNTGEKA